MPERTANRYVTARPAPVVHHYVDPVEGFHGFLAFHDRRHRLAAGGFRVQQGLTRDTITRLAAVMDMKERLLGLAVDGAKAGMDYDPTSPGKREAMRRFLGFLRPHLEGRLSLGPDMGTKWHEIEQLAREQGLASVKMAIARAQGLEPQEVLKRLAVLDTVVEGLSVGERRAGHALAHAGLAAARWKRAGGPVRATVHGFGTLGRGAALSLVRAGAVVTAVADEHGVVISEEGLDLGELLRIPPAAPVTGCGVGRASGAPADLFGVEADILVLASCENAVPPEEAAALPVQAVVVGANLGLRPEAEEILHGRGTVVVPDVVGGCGGSASMDALFGPLACPSPEELLGRLGARMEALVDRIMELARTRGIGTREAVLSLCEEDVPAGSRPYGRAGVNEWGSRHGDTREAAVP